MQTEKATPMPESLKENPEAVLSRFHSDFIFDDFVFLKNTHNPQIGKTIELGDNLICIRKRLFLYQVKGRNRQPFKSEKDELRWFDNKIIIKAADQIKDNVEQIRQYKGIPLLNKRGTTHEISEEMITGMTKVILFRPHLSYGLNNPFKVKHILSQKVGFIHCLSVYEYMTIAMLLMTPLELLLYFNHRQHLIQNDGRGSQLFHEYAILGNYLLSQLPENNGTPLPLLPEQALFIDEIDRDLDGGFILTVFRGIANSVHKEGSEYDKQGCLTTLEIVSSLKRGAIEVLTNLCNTALNVCMSATFNSQESAGFSLIGMVGPYLGEASFSVIAINELDSLAAININRAAGLAAIERYKKEGAKFNYHVAIAFKREAGDIRSFWTLLEYDLKGKVIPPEIQNGLNNITFSSVYAPPFKLKSKPIILP